jgi:1,4-dihydroxy-2-naphthoate polyprenyltransferase
LITTHGPSGGLDTEPQARDSDLQQRYADLGQEMITHTPRHAARAFIHPPGEPDVEAFDTSLPGRIRRYWLALRPSFFQASVMPVLAGTAWGATQSGSLNLTSALLAALCMVLGHGAANLVNDVQDDITGNDSANMDRIHPFSGGSRFIQNGVMSRRAMLDYALALLALAAILGLILLIRHGWDMVWFGAVLGGLLALYLVPPVRLGYRGLAEPLFALSFGVVPVLMAGWLQTGSIGPLTVLVSLPVAMWAASILLISGIPDRDADARTAKRTFVVLFGVERARILHKTMNAVAFGALLMLMVLGHLSIWGLIGAAVLLGLGLRSANSIDTGDRERMTAAIRITWGVHGLGCLWLTGWILLS